MKCRQDKYHYKRNLKVSLILSLFAVILIFYLTPNFTGKIHQPPEYVEPVLQIVEMPRTNQNAELPSLPPELKPVQSLPVSKIIDSPVIEDIENKTNVTDSDGETADITISDQGESGKKIITSLPFNPRQIVEVFPKEVSGAKGEIKLSLRIGKDGKVIKHKILSNNTTSEECLSNILDAVYKSRWQPVIIEGDRFEYIIEKTYYYN